MRTRFILVSSIFFASVCRCIHAQANAPTSGEITVKLIEGLDSARSQPGIASHAIVTKSTNPAIKKDSPATVQLGVDPTTGGLSVQLVQITIGGQQLKTASSKAVLAGGLIPGLNDALNKADKSGNRILLAGPHVYVPGNTYIQFSLTNTGDALSTQAKQQQSDTLTPGGPNVWKAVSIPESSESMAGNGMTIEGIATSGARRGRVHLQVSCYTKGFNATSISMAEALLGRTPEDYAAAADDHTSLARLKIGNDSIQNASLMVRKKAASTSLVLDLGVPDDFYTEKYAGKPVVFSILSPDGKSTVAEASFVLPADPSPMLPLVAPCIEHQKQALADSARAMAEIAAKIVVSCPDKAGKTLAEAKVKLIPSGRVLEGDATDGTVEEWDLTTLLKRGQHAALECDYTDPKLAKTAPGNRITLPIPASAVICQSTTDGNNPVDGTCSKK